MKLKYNTKRSRNNGLGKCLISVTLLSIISYAYAGFDAEIDPKNPITIPVHSHLVDKSKYAGSNALSSTVRIKFRGQCDFGYLHAFGLELGGVNYPFPGLNGENKSITGNSGSNWHTHTMSGQQVLPADNPTIIKACNDYITTKKNQGFDIETLLASDFSVDNAISLPLHLTFSCIKKNGSNDLQGNRIPDKLDVKALCKATNYKEPINVSGVEFRIDKQVTMGGVCKLQLKGVLNTSKPNQLVRFRYEHIDKSFKKKLSKTHQVTTDSQGYANFAHEYPVPNGPGKERGKMRVLGVSHEFQSAQKNYSMSCNDGGPGSLQQAGKSTIKLKAKPIKNSNKPFGNQVCPTKVKFTGTIKAGNDFSGKAVFIGQSLADVQVKNFSIKKGKTKRVTRVRNLKWSAPSSTTLSTGGGVSSQLMKQNLLQGLNIVGDNSQNVILSVPRRSFSVSCTRPAVQPGLQIQNGGLTTFPSHTGGGAPTDIQGNQQTVSPKMPPKPSPKKKDTEKKKKRNKPKN